MSRCRSLPAAVSCSDGCGALHARIDGALPAVSGGGEAPEVEDSPRELEDVPARHGGAALEQLRDAPLAAQEELALAYAILDDVLVIAADRIKCFLRRLDIRLPYIQMDHMNPFVLSIT